MLWGSCGVGVSVVRVAVTVGVGGLVSQVSVIYSIVWYAYLEIVEKERNDRS